jgi:hypothetical protein
MKTIAWGLYGLGVVVTLLAMLSSELGILPKTLLAASVFFIGAITASLLQIADRMSNAEHRRKTNDHSLDDSSLNSRR